MAGISASSAEGLYDEFVKAGLLITAGPVGAFARGAVFEQVLEAFDALILRIADHEQVETMTFPPVIDRAIIERTGYMESFPNLCGAIHSFAGNDREARAIPTRIAEGQAWGDLLSPTDVVLTPAACYPFYPTCRGTVPANGREVTLRSWVYRQEPSIEPTRMRAFRMREVVRIGAPDTVLAWRDQWRDRGLAILRSLDLPAELDIAADPFFGRAGKMLAAGQIEQKLKFEVLIPILPALPPTACASFNYHQDKFGTIFGIRLLSGETAHSACLGFGLERTVMALFRTHGADPAHWPATVRALLWP
ncbi:amino acid--[acyl-carrier-protein] ligase [Gemmatimonas sp.]|uniref:amino acid--[acyl-carrier-protein] ligase n=1 Tax=Gemmatimonas sp. TaxID=1962908 RepID=UPI003DA699EB